MLAHFWFKVICFATWNYWLQHCSQTVPSHPDLAPLPKAISCNLHMPQRMLCSVTLFYFSERPLRMPHCNFRDCSALCHSYKVFSPTPELLQPPLDSEAFYKFQTQSFFFLKVSFERFSFLFSYLGQIHSILDYFRWLCILWGKSRHCQPMRNSMSNKKHND